MNEHLKDNSLFHHLDGYSDALGTSFCLCNDNMNSL